MLFDNIHEKWKPIIIDLFYNNQKLKELFEKILPYISYQPKKEDIFNIFSMNPSDIKVVILGKDPYPTPGNAIGKAFAVSRGVKIPASLRVIHREVEESVESPDPSTRVDIDSWKILQHWQDQGIFLLNTALTVETGKAGSHIDYWRGFSNFIISYLSSYKEISNIVWLLWGEKAKSFQYLIKNQIIVDDIYEDIPQNKNYILTAPHPAASLYGGSKSFIGCDHFNKTNRLLRLNKQKQIYW